MIGCVTDARADVRADVRAPDVARLGPDATERALTSVLAAFATDPLLRWVWPEDQRYAECAQAFFRLLLSLRTAGGEVWAADGGAAVAMWDPPGGLYAVPAEDPWPLLNSTFTEAEQGRWRVFNESLAVPADAPAHWYLGVLATAPEHQRRGLGAAVVAPVLAAADRTATEAYLETASEANVAFYARLGFTVVREVDVPGAGPRCWLLRREPRTSR
jgi:ribosomal protein S18 acetylase RimI-like enzyme